MSFRLPLIATLALAAVSMADAAPEYNFIDLGTLGGVESRAYGLNDLGQVVGYSTLADSTRRAFLYDTTSGMTNLGALGTTLSMAYDISNLGVVTGRVGNDAFIYENGIMAAIDMPGTGSKGMAVNDLGQIAATSFVDGTSDAAFAGLFGDKAFTISGGTSTLLPLPAGASGSATIGVNDMNSAGMIVGSGSATPAVWNAPAGFSTALSAALSTAIGGSLQDVVLNDVNENGAVSGWALSTGFSQIAFIYDNGALQVLSPGSVSVFINDIGQATYAGRLLDDDGQSYLLSDITHGLNGFVLGGVAGINNQGAIIGTGVTAGGETHAFLLTPVPEPGSFTLLLAAGGWLVMGRRRHAAFAV